MAGWLEHETNEIDQADKSKGAAGRQRRIKARTTTNNRETGRADRTWDSQEV